MLNQTKVLEFIPLENKSCLKKRKDKPFIFDPIFDKEVNIEIIED